MHIECGLVLPQFQQRQLVWIKHALKDFELLAAGFPHDLDAALAIQLRKLRSFSRHCGDGDDEADWHGELVSEQLRAFIREQPADALAVVGQVMAERTALLEKLRELQRQMGPARR